MKAIKAHPLQWPSGWSRTKEPTRSKFGTYYEKPTVAASTNYALDELRKMKIDRDDVVISSNLTLRLDGLPRSNQVEPEDSGVAVYFVYKGDTMVIACDAFDKCGCNLHAIAKTVDAMRGIDRWGCSELLNQAFTGFKALPETGTPDTAHKSWWELLGVPENANVDQIEIAYKYMCKVFHPDMPSGSHEKFIQIKEAYEQAKSTVLI